MQCGANGIWDETGCFVYEITAPHRICVRNSPCSSPKPRQIQDFYYFECGELVSIDLIRHNREDYTDPIGSNHSVGLHPGAHASITRRRRRRSDDGPFLRLSDGSGWILARSDGQDLAKRVYVEDANHDSDEKRSRTPFWNFRADNLPLGIELRRHPNEELRNPNDTNRFSSPGSGGIRYLPMQRIVCDRKITTASGVSFFRVQGTCGWVFDRRSSNGSNHTGQEPYREMMIRDDLVDTGLFAFRVTSTEPIAVRRSCHVGDGPNNLGPTVVQHGDTLLVDVVRRSPLQDANGNGPFLRLVDGSGWLFQHRRGVPGSLLEEVPIENGVFRLRILQVPDHTATNHGQPFLDRYQHRGLSSKVTNNYNSNNNLSPRLKQGEIVSCDRKVVVPSPTSSAGICWCRQVGTDQWIMVKQQTNEDDDEDMHDGGHIVAEIVPEPEHPASFLRERTAGDVRKRETYASSNGAKRLQQQPWSPRLVRSYACMVPGLEEIGFDRQHQILSFKSSNGVIFNIYCENRVIGILSVRENTIQGCVQRYHRNCSDLELREILQDTKTCRGEGVHRCDKRARSFMPPSPIRTRFLADEEDCNNSEELSLRENQNIITPDTSSSSSAIGTGFEMHQDYNKDDDTIDTELECRMDLVDCQRKIQNLLYRQGNILRAIKVYEEERMRDAEAMRAKSERIRIEHRENQRQVEQLQHQRRVEEDDRQARWRRTCRQLVSENVFVGAFVGGVVGLVLSPYCGPLLVQKLGLQHL